MPESIDLKTFPELESIVLALIDLCDKKQFEYPEITAEISVKDSGRKFKLTFERTQ